MKQSTVEKFVQTVDECQIVPPPPHHPDPVCPRMLAEEAEHLSQHHSQYLPLDQIYAESLPSITIPQLDGHDDVSHVHSEKNVVDFADIINHQEEERRRHVENAQLEREADLENF